MCASKFISKVFVFALAALLCTAQPVLLNAQQSPEAAAPAAAQKKEPQETIVKVVRVRPEDTDQFAELLRSFEVMIRVSGKLGLLTIAGHADNVDRAETAVREIQNLTMRNPGSNSQDVALTVYFLGIVDEDSPMPPGALRDVVAELKKTFPFKGYALLETVVLRTRVGDQSQVSGLLPEVLSEGFPPKRYSFESRLSAIEPQQNSQVVRFAYVRATIQLPVRQGSGINWEAIQISTGLEVPDGKTVVVGKAGAVGESQGYLLAVTANVEK